MTEQTATLKVEIRVQKTAEEAEDALEAARKALLTMVTEAVENTGGVRATRIADRLEDVAIAEGAYEFWLTAAAMLDQGHGLTEIIDHGVDYAIRSDDTWSGRGNDTRRSVADGYRKAFERFYQWARYAQLADETKEA